jgi:hypothetical protein
MPAILANRQMRPVVLAGGLLDVVAPLFGLQERLQLSSLAR